MISMNHLYCKLDNYFILFNNYYPKENNHLHTTNIFFQIKKFYLMFNNKGNYQLNYNNYNQYLKIN